MRRAVKITADRGGAFRRRKGGKFYDQIKKTAEPAWPGADYQLYGGADCGTVGIHGHRLYPGLPQPYDH